MADLVYKNLRLRSTQFFQKGDWKLQRPDMKNQYQQISWSLIKEALLCGSDQTCMDKIIKTKEKIPGGGTIDHVENIIKIKWKLRQEYQSIGNKELYLITIRKAKSPVYFAKKTVNK